MAFRTHVRTGRPFVVLKMASSLDGKAAARDGSSKWITGEEARADVQRLRAWSDAVVVGSGTALADDPRLTVRDPAFASARPPVRVVVDPSGRVPGDRRALDATAPTLIATTELTPTPKRQEWVDAGADVAVLDRDRHRRRVLAGVDRSAREAGPAGCRAGGRSDARLERDP